MSGSYESNPVKIDGPRSRAHFDFHPHKAPVWNLWSARNTFVQRLLYLSSWTVIARIALVHNFSPRAPFQIQIGVKIKVLEQMVWRMQQINLTLAERHVVPVKSYFQLVRHARPSKKKFIFSIAYFIGSYYLHVDSNMDFVRCSRAGAIHKGYSRPRAQRQKSVEQNVFGAGQYKLISNRSLMRIERISILKNISN